jgi:hypothetical protein
VGTVNIGSRAPACPLFIVALREKWSTVIQGKRPPIRARIGLVSNLEITFLTSSTAITNEIHSCMIPDLENVFAGLHGIASSDSPSATTPKFPL